MREGVGQNIGYTRLWAGREWRYYNGAGRALSYSALTDHTRSTAINLPGVTDGRQLNAMNE